jgi:chemotaxis protein CheX
MDVKYINPFVNAFANVLPQVGLADVKKKGLSLKGRHIDSLGVMIIVGLIGDIKGNIIYNTSIENAKKISSAMMMGMQVSELDELAQSAISELTNMLTANAATEFSNINIDVNISTPTLMYGNFTATASTDNVICVEMLANDISFEINIAAEITKC